MALENLSPIVREERLLAGEDLEPATRLEYFLKQAGSGGSGSVEYEPVLAETTKSVNEHGWSTSFSGGPIFEGTSYRVTVNGVTYEPLIGTAGDLSYICLGNTYVDDADPAGDYPFGIFYKNGELTAWLETGESITMQIDQIIQLVPVPTPAAADTGKVLTANNGSVKWEDGSAGGLFVVHSSYDETLDSEVLDKTWQEINDAALTSAVILVNIAEMLNTTFVFYLTQAASAGGNYTVIFSQIDQNNIRNYTYAATSANGYPARI